MGDICDSEGLGHYQVLVPNTDLETICRSTPTRFPRVNSSLSAGEFSIRILCQIYCGNDFVHQTGDNYRPGGHNFNRYDVDNDFDDDSINDESSTLNENSCCSV